jgi:hypothetical protein
MLHTRSYGGKLFFRALTTLLCVIKCTLLGTESRFSIASSTGFYELSSHRVTHHIHSTLQVQSRVAQGLHIVSSKSCIHKNDVSTHKVLFYR